MLALLLRVYKTVYLSSSSRCGLREISSLRKDHMDDQALMEEKRKEVFAGDVHEYSNYLVSIVNAQEDGYGSHMKR